MRPDKRCTDEFRQRRRDAQERKLIASGKPYIVCLICGRKLRIMSTHLARRHQMTARRYVLQFRLPLGTRLAPEDWRQERRDWYFDNPEYAERFMEMATSPERKLALAAWSRKSAADRSAAMRIRGVTPDVAAARLVRLVANKEKAISTRRQQNLANGLHVNRTCQQCGIDYDGKRSGRVKFCSHACYHRSKRGRDPFTDDSRMAAAVTIRTKHRLHGKTRISACAYCASEFETSKSRNRKHCGRTCWGLAHSRRMVERNRLRSTRVTKSCKKCGSAFSSKPSAGAIYCSMACRDKRVDMTCTECGTVFTAGNNKENALCKSCYQSNWKRAHRKSA